MLPKTRGLTVVHVSATRWDMQRLRERQQLEKLQQSHAESRSNNTRDEEIGSFLPCVDKRTIYLLYIKIIIYCETVMKLTNVTCVHLCSKSTSECANSYRSSVSHTHFICFYSVMEKYLTGTLGWV